MNESAARHFRKSAGHMRISRVTLKWRYASTGTYDAARNEYADGVGSYITLDDVPCIIYQLTPGRLAYGNWGNAQSGDLIVSVSTDIDIDDMEDISVILNGVEYKVVPNSTIQHDALGGVVGTTLISKALHCRFMGAR